MDFDPNLNPNYADGFVSEEDVEKAKQREINRFNQGEVDRIEVTCPKCFNEFEVSNEK